MVSTQFFTLTTIYFLALLSPGQDFFLIIKHALAHGYKKAWWSCWGIASGNALYIILAYIGYTALSAYPTLISFIEYGGAIFLFYLGCLLFLAPKPRIDTSLHQKSKMAFTLFIQGFFVSTTQSQKHSVLLFTALYHYRTNNSVTYQTLLCALDDWDVTCMGYVRCSPLWQSTRIEALAISRLRSKSYWSGADGI